MTYEPYEHVALVNGTSLLDAFTHFTEVDVGIGLHMAIVLRGMFLSFGLIREDML